MALKDYRDPILQKLIDVFEAEGPASLRGHYIQGDVLYTPRREMPLVSVAREETDISSDSTMTDNHVMPIVVELIIDWAADENRSFDLVRGTTQLYELIEGRSEDYRLKADTLSYVIRNNDKLDPNLFISIKSGSLRISYGRGWEKRGTNIFSVEGILRFDLEFTQPKPKYYEN